MKLFTIHVQRYGIDPALDIRPLKEGFNWLACFFTVLWALFCGYWMVAGLLLAAEVIISLILSAIGLDLLSQAVVNIAFNLLVGIYANDLARWTLKRRGYSEEEVVSGINSEHALERYVQTLQTN